MSATTTTPSTPQKSDKNIPQWLPISLIALSVAAIAGPVFLYRRNRANVLLESLQTPRIQRYASGTAANLRSRGLPVTASNHTAAATAKHTSSAAPGDKFNAALLTAKAFGIATLGVCSFAAATVVSVKYALGVRDTAEFAHRMRLAVRTHLPTLVEKLHRAPEEPLESDWNSEDAQTRMSEAYQKDGLSGWFNVAMREADMEARVEKARRDRGETAG